MIVFCTTPDKKTAKNIANLLVKNALVVCVSISKIKSIYVWDGQICKEKEYQLIIKSRRKNFKSVKDKILTAHPYDTPEIFSLKFDKIDKKYKKWIKISTNKDKK